jgi:hypothetical protein
LSRITNATAANEYCWLDQQAHSVPRSATIRHCAYPKLTAMDHAPDRDLGRYRQKTSGLGYGPASPRKRDAG